MNIDLPGWEKVHTWYESHGDGRQDSYQRSIAYEMNEPFRDGNTDPQILWRLRDNGRTPCLTVSIDRRGHCKVWTEPRGYALATWVRQSIAATEGRWVLQKTTISPCCTAGYEVWSLDEDDIVVTLTRVAGHGEEAYISPSKYDMK
jgi:hypothetical protein